jgi:hypothetical protein
MLEVIRVLLITENNVRIVNSNLFMFLFLVLIGCTVLCNYLNPTLNRKTNTTSNLKYANCGVIDMHFRKLTIK